MILDIFTQLSNMIYATPAIALMGALLWGVVSVILSPCHLAGIPVVIGFVADRSGGSRRSAFVLSTIFSLGILATIALLGFVTALAGRMLGDIGPYGKWITGGVFLLVGLLLLDILQLPSFWSGSSERLRGGGKRASFVLGLLFGTALGPCAFAFIMPVLGLVFSIAATHPLYAAGLIGAYAIGHCGVIIAAGTSATMVNRIMKAEQRSHHLRMIRKVCGVLVIAAGLWMVFT